MLNGHQAQEWTPPVPHTLRDYALLADGERGAVVGPEGDIAWMCAPRWDSPAVFASLIGGNGCYGVSPVGRFVWGGYYEEGSLIWRSRWTGVDGEVLESREALLAPGRPDRAVVLRRLSAIEGESALVVALELRDGYGEQPARSVRRDEEGVWHLRTPRLFARWSGAAEAVDQPDGRGGRRLVLQIALGKGAARDLILEVSEHPFEEPPFEARPCWEATERFWSDSVPILEHVAGQRDARHAYAVLRGLTASTGGMVAAATTSLPERASAGRNYDYRFSWIRDQCYSGVAVARNGPHQLLDDAVRFVGERLRADGPDLRPAYTTTGELIPDQKRLGLPGYPGGFDIVGNQVTKQFQLDAFGDALLLFAAAAGLDRLTLEDWQAAEIAAGAIEKRWQDADAGVWELEPRRWTQSRLECVAGLRSLAVAAGTPSATASRWSALADAILAEVASAGLHPSGRWQRADDDERVDASLLLAAVRGAVAHADPRSVATFHAVREELTDDGYVYRFRHDERPLGKAEGAFLLCGFWMSLAALGQGRPIEAARWFERSRSACGPPGLLSEEFDVGERQLRGNVPQAFVHALLIECAAAQVEEARL